MTSVKFPTIQLMGQSPHGSRGTSSNGSTQIVFPPIVAMETEQRFSPPSPKKNSFVPLRLGPVARVMTQIDNLSPPKLPSAATEANYVNKTLQELSRNGGKVTTTPGSKTTMKYPRIIVRDSQGRTLDTFTTLQEAIYRASWTRKKRGEWPKTQLEWRLPKSPCPSKPDFTRAGPRSLTSLPLESNASRRERILHQGMPRLCPTVTSANTPANQRTGREITLTADVLVNIPTLEIPVDDVSFIAQSLQHLPHLPSFSFLRHSLLAGQSTYVQMVASILLHQRHLQATDTRQSDYSFPGFCRGCKRSGFCYGCSKSSRPHIHEDIPSWTGGGFRFWKPDRPRQPHSWKNPNNWKLPSTEQELQNIIQKYGGLAAYEKAVIAARREMVTSQYQDLSEWTHPPGSVSDGRITRLERITTLGSYPPQVTIISTDKFEDEAVDFIDESLCDEETRTREGDEDFDGSEEAERIMRRRMERRQDRSRSHESPSRRRRIGVTSYKDDVSVVSRSQSGHNVSVVSDGSAVRIDTGFGDEIEESEAGRNTHTGGEESEKGGDETRESRRRVRLITSAGYDSGEGMMGREASRLSTSTRPQSYSDGRKTSESSNVSRKTSRLTFKDEAKEEEEREEAMRRKEQDEEDKGQKEEQNGQNKDNIIVEEGDVGDDESDDNADNAPKFFVVQKKTRRITTSKDPFSTDRELNLPKGPAFQLKKGDRKQTKFIDFKKGDRSWKAPKAFEVKHNDNKNTKFWSPPTKKDADDGNKSKRRGQSKDRRLQRTKTDMSTDSGLPTEKEDTDLQDDLDGKDGQGDGTDLLSVNTTTNNKMAVVQTYCEPRQDIVDKAMRIHTLSPETSADQSSSDLLQNATDGRGGEEDNKPKRREIVKKTRVEKTRPQTPPKTPPRLPSPPVFKRRKSRTPTPSPPPSPDLPPPEVPLPDFDMPSVPDLPTIGDNKPDARKQRMKFAVEAPPPLKEVKKKRKPPPKVRIIPKSMYKKRKTRPAEAPVTQEELMDIQDPLDFLAKYCIINPDRLPFYEIIFETTVAEQEPLYTQEGGNKEEGEGEQMEHEEDDGKKKKSKKKKSSPKSDEKDPYDVIKPELLPANRGMDMSKAVMTIEEQHLEKLIYTLDLLHDKMDRYSIQLATLEDNRTRLLAEKARDVFPEVTAPDYFPKLKQKGKKGKKSKTPVEPPTKLRPDQITDEVIVARLDDKMLSELYTDPAIHNVDIEMNRLKEKIGEVQTRVEEIASEKLLADAFCMNHFFLRQGLNNNNNSKNNDLNKENDNNSNNNNNDNDDDDGNNRRTKTENLFRRQQSELYNRLHPQPDYEMNMEEVEGALQQINNHLLTEKEFVFLYNVLNLPRRSKLNFRLFTIIAALSEKVTQLDPVIKQLMNNFNYNALDVKMEKCKELFDLLESDNMPMGGAQASSLAVELTAGGLRPENINHVLHKFNREDRGVVDFLDFVTYVPLFVEIHKRIISDPLCQESDL